MTPKDSNDKKEKSTPKKVAVKKKVVVKKKAAVEKAVVKNDLKSSCKIYLEYSKYDEIEIPKEFKILKEKSVGDVKALLLIKNEN